MATLHIDPTTGFPIDSEGRVITSDQWDQPGVQSAMENGGVVGPMRPVETAQTQGAASSPLSFLNAMPKWVILAAIALGGYWYFTKAKRGRRRK